ncbi:hypothetical protein CERSUDRAFT_144628 [Gelatoporia subvermispora B]|uniref:DUF654-domain-containing protein n=1 Tax=Ceriporiopsis subvermispora (strain B) TaxID=914234 RepID=M2QZ31_CERS8|nr:hypothetical protein CERSUDRAFT_144628 [Gelatoporia subvermispora B]
MPPRPNKRQLREQEELQALEAARDVNSEEESDVGLAVPAKPSATGFAALMNTFESDEEDEEELVARSSKSKKALSGLATPASPSSEQPKAQPAPVKEASHAPSPGPSKKEKKALKKQKQKAKDNVDEVDKALAELSVKYPEFQQVAAANAASPAARSASQSLAGLLSVSLQHLDSEAEMRKFFGAKVISAARSSEPGSSSSRRVATMQRSHLTDPKQTWFPAQMREGLSVRQYLGEDVEELRERHGWDTLLGEKIWAVEYSKKYRGVTLAFMQTVMSGDPEGFYQLQRVLPYHADTLLQLSEVYHHREGTPSSSYKAILVFRSYEIEHSTASDFVDRALFAYERAFVGSFNFTGGNNRLDFDRVENRPFFLALHRQLVDLQRRGCVRTAFEFGRLLYALEPWTDPHGALLHLDFLAIKAGMHDWLLKLWDLFATQPDGSYRNRLQVTALPGWSYARALALYIEEESKGDKVHEKSTNALKEAVLAFPSTVPLLADKADISLTGAVRGHKVFRIHTDASTLSTQAEAIVHLLSHIYAQRSFSLWKIPSRASWFAQTVESTLSSLSSPIPARRILADTLFANHVLALSIYRHTIVNEASCRRLFSFIPRDVTNAKHLACDPLPPPTRVNEYNEDFFRGAEDALAVRPLGRKATERMLERMIPDPVFRRQLQAFWEAHPAFAQRFPGGILQFAQIAGQMPEEVLEDLLIAEVAGGGEGHGMPGQMPDIEMLDVVDDDDQDAAPVNPATPQAQIVAQEDADEEDDDEDEDEDGEVAPLPVRIFRNVFNRFWGGRVAPDESSDDDNRDQTLQDQGGVD